MCHGGGWLEGTCIGWLPVQVRWLTRCYHVTWVMMRETGNLVVKVDVKENVEERPMMDNTLRLA
jgi:hypothetical protein